MGTKSSRKLVSFCPRLKELDENVDYEERESEFDLTDEDKSVDLAAEAKHDEEIEVDVTKIEPIAAFCSSDEEGEDDNALKFLPMAPEVEDPEDGCNSQDNSGHELMGGMGRDDTKSPVPNKKRLATRDRM